MGYRGVVALALIALVPVAVADFSDCLLQVQACLPDGTCLTTCSITAEDGTGYWEGDIYYWSLDDNMPLMFLGETIGVLVADDDVAGTNLTNIVYGQDPEVTVNFAVTAGSGDTVFTLVSGHNSFPTINSPLGRAEVSLGVTDRNGGGAYLNSVTAGEGKSFSHINGLYPGGAMWAELMETNLSAAPWGSDSGSDETGALQPIGTPVSSMSTAVEFTLSASDLGIGTSIFQVTPEPSSLLMLLMLGLLRRRS